MKLCMKCGKKIDKNHDLYYYCKCDKNLKIFCPTCRLSIVRCPVCKRALSKHTESISKKTYNNPATRNGLGF